MLNPTNYLQRLNPALLQRLRGQGAAQSAASAKTQQTNPYGDAFDRGANAMHRGSGKARGVLARAQSEASNNFRLSAHLGVRSNSIDWDRGGRAGYSKDWVNTKNDLNTFADRKWSNRPDDERAANGTGIPVNATLFNVGARREATVASVRAETTVAGANLHGEIYAGRLRGTTSMGASVDLNSMTAKLDGGVRGEAHLLGVSAGGSRVFGGSAINTTTSVRGDAYVGAEAGAKAGVNFNPRTGDAGVSAGLDAFAGAKAKGKVRQSFGAAGENLGAVGVRGEAWAGIGASADASAGFEDGKFKISGSIGAALGVGGKVGFDLEIDVVGTAKAASKVAGDAVDMASEVASDAIDMASEVAGDVANAFSSGWSSIKKLW
jgi:hypothetical protein